MKSQADMLIESGKALYGEQWRVELCSALEVSDATLRHWISRGTRIPVGVFRDVLELLADKQRLIAETPQQIATASMIKKLIQWMLNQDGMQCQ